LAYLTLFGAGNKDVLALVDPLHHFLCFELQPAAEIVIVDFQILVEVGLQFFHLPLQPN
jgi:hypothetical protein